MTKFLDNNGLSYFWEKITDKLGDKVDSADIASVATSGSYNDLTDKPTIPTITFRQW